MWCLGFYKHHAKIKMYSSYLLSIIIPTRNRQSVLLQSLQQIMKVINGKVQIVIQDNSDNESLRDDLSKLKYCNIKYNYTKERLSFVDNFDIATSLADGQYLCMIGDDDGVCEEIVKVVEWAAKNNYDSIIPNVDFEYFWPNSIKLYGMESRGIARILQSKPKIRKIDAEKGVINVLKNGCQNYMKYDVVKLYHGIVKKDCIEKVHNIAGKYFGGVSPDIYISIALSLVCKSNFRIMMPLTIAGVCKKSGSADSSNGKHIGTYNAMPHLNGHIDYVWSDLVPKFYSVESVWADSAIKAIEDMKRQDLLKYYNFAAFDAICKLNYGDYTKWIDKTSVAYPLKNKSLVITKEKIKHYMRRVFWRLSRLGKKLLIQNDLKDLNVAYEFYRSSSRNDIKDIVDKIKE